MPLDSERWREVERLFAKAADLGPADRGALLDRECQDAAVRREVERLLAHDSGSTGRIADPIREATGMAGVDGRPEGIESEGSDLEGDDPGTSVLERIGPYRIERELGRGGMGTVFLASRDDDQYRKQVAIKLVRAGVDSDTLLRRFRAERQILASLEHSNIARLLDGGATEEGQSYLVMEHVDGEPIDTYCDRLHLDIDARLRIFRAVCAAVQHAHRNLIVHRDIKPANVLVTAEGEPKLVDFGIAKLLDAEAAAPTMTMARMMTPEYASPEQVRGEVITTSSDIYSLGVLLYELLTGRRPYRLASRRIGEVARAIGEQEPERPSTAVTREPLETDPGGATTTAEELCRVRGALPRELRRRLTGDLDDIVMMTLRKEPERRYASVADLSEDIRRHLEGLPVLARKDTWTYRAAKFARRNPWGVGAMAAILLLITGSSAVVWLQGLRIAGERDRAVAAEGEARTEAATAQRVTDFLVGLFEYATPAEARGREIPVREVLDRGARRVREELAGEPEVQARLMATIAEVYASLGLSDSAMPLAHQALEKEIGLHGESAPHVARLHRQIGGLLVQTGEREQAESEILAALEAQRALLGPDHDDIVESLNTLGNLRDLQGRYEEAGKHHHEALEMARRLHGESHILVGKSANLLGWNLRRRGELVKSERMHRENLAMLRDLVGEDHPTVGNVLNNLAQVLGDMGRYEEAEEAQREALALNGRLNGEESVGYAIALNNLAAVLKVAGKPVEAEPLQRRSIEILTRLLGPEHPLTMARLNNLANLYHDQGKLAEAEEIHRRVLSYNRRTLGDLHPETLGSLNNLASLLWDAGRYDEAEPFAREVLEGDIETLGPDHGYVAMDYSNLGVILRDRGKVEDRKETESVFAKSVEVARKAFGEIHPNVATNEAQFGIFLVRTGRLEEGERRVREALRIYQEALDPDHFQIDMAKAMLGECLGARGRYQEAEPLAVESYRSLREKLGEQSGVTRRARARVARLYAAWGKDEKAAAYGP